MISGTGRSGTNVTKAIFDRHSKVATLPFEYRIVVDPAGIIDFYNSFTASWSPFAADYKIRELEKFLISKASLDEGLHAKGEQTIALDPTGRKIAPPSYHGWELQKWIPGYTQLVRRLIDQLTSFTYSGRWPGTASFAENNRMYFSDKYTGDDLILPLREFITGLTRSILQKQNREVFVEDNTWNILFARELFEILPQSRLIHMVRDPRDVVASMIHQNWAPDNLDEAIIFYKSIINRWFQIENQIDQNRFTMVKLEDLIREPEKVIPEICTFSGLEFESQMAATDLTKANTGRWKQQFTPGQIKTLNQSLEGVIERLGYGV